MHLLRKLRYSILGMIFGIYASTALAADATQAMTEQATEAYGQKKYTEVVSLASQVPGLDTLDPVFFAQVAQSEYRLKNDGEAALWYKRLLLLEPTQPEARQNLGFLHKKHGSVGEVRLPSPVTAWIQEHTPVLIMAASILFWLLVASFAIKSFYFYNKKYTPITLTIKITCLIVTLSIAGVVYLAHPPKHFNQLALITQPGAVAFAGASTTSGQVITLPLASEVILLQERGSWSYVEIHPKDEEPKRGWVKSNLLKKLWPFDQDFLPKLI